MAEAIAEVFVRVRPETAGFKSALSSQLRGDLNQTSSQVNRMSKGTDAGTKALSAFKNAAVFASGALIGGYGLAYGLKEVTKAATDHVALEAQLQNAVKNSGLSYAQYATEIQAAIRAQESLGFAEDVSTRSFTLALRATGSVSGANRLLATSANVARGANKDLYSSTLVLVRAYDGATTGLKRLGIQVEKGSKGFDVINQVQKKYAGAAVGYSNTAAGAQARLTVAIHQTEIAIGTALLPTVTRLSTKLSKWLDNTKHQAEIQKTVNGLVTVTTGLLGPLAANAGQAAAGIGQLADEFGRLNAETKISSSLSFGGVFKFLTTGPKGVYDIVANAIKTENNYLHQGGTPKGTLTFASVLPALQQGVLSASAVRKLKPRFRSENDYNAALAYATQNERAAYVDQAAARGVKPDAIGSSGTGTAKFGAQLLSPLDRARSATIGAGANLKTLTSLHLLLQKNIATETNRLKYATTAKEAKKFQAVIDSLSNEDAAALSQIASI